MRENTFDFDDFLDQLQQIQKNGSVGRHYENDSRDG
nr:hypothetical protein [Apilactobacillus ozensis]